MLALIGYPVRLMSFLSRLEQRFITLADQPGAIYDNPAGYSQQRDPNHQRPQAVLIPVAFAYGRLGLHGRSPISSASVRGQCRQSLRLRQKARVNC
jgi:hypothetical protein